jgi:hypothetical protein
MTTVEVPRESLRERKKRLTREAIFGTAQPGSTGEIPEFAGV